MIPGPEPWVGFCRDAVTEVKGVLVELPGRVLGAVGAVGELFND